MGKSFYNILRYYVFPPFALVFFTVAAPALSLIGRGQDWTDMFNFEIFFGNLFSWKIVASMIAWAYFWLKVPSKEYLGPPTINGYRPKYKDNGFLYFWITFASFCFAQTVLFPDLSSNIWANMPEIVSSFNLLALVICLWLWIKGNVAPEHKEDVLEPRPFFYEFFCGKELHPRIMGVNVKQLINCRISMMLWELLVTAFFFASIRNHDLNAANLMNFILQTVYLAKFFWWETGYFNTLDIILDRAGYYISWGCLVWVTSLYSFSAYYLVNHEPAISMSTAYAIGYVGLLSIFLNYRVDYEKLEFRRNPSTSMWGRPATYLTVTYTLPDGSTAESKLLTCGFWGKARHINYTFEIIAAFSWCGQGLFLSVWPFCYSIFLSILLVHRTFRDEHKCSRKYGEGWNRYCDIVRYRYIPHVI